MYFLIPHLAERKTNNKKKFAVASISIWVKLKRTKADKMYKTR